MPLTDAIYPALAVTVKETVLLRFTACCPGGEIVPFAPADEVTIGGGGVAVSMPVVDPLVFRIAAASGLPLGLAFGEASSSPTANKFE